jgi:hypothetical protein
MELFGKKMPAFKPRDFLRRLILVWYFSHRYLFFVLLLVTVSVGAWFWKQAVYQYHWTDAQKRAYLNEHAKETSFKEDKFTSALDSVAAKERSFQENRDFRDIFYP